MKWPRLRFTVRRLMILVAIWVNENTRREDEWAWRMAARYQRLSYYSWLNADPALPPPQPLDHPRPARELPPPDNAFAASVWDSRPPLWTVLWTWDPSGPLLLEESGRDIFAP